MKKYLQLFENADAMRMIFSAADGQPWVGAETATKTVRYEKTGVGASFGDQEELN